MPATTEQASWPGQFEAWENSFPLKALQPEAESTSWRAASILQVPSRIQHLTPHLLFVVRAAIGTALASAFVYLPGISDTMTGSSRFFAVIIPCLAVGPTVGSTLLQLAGLPVIICAVMFATFLVQGIARNSSVMHCFLCVLGVFSIQWGSVSTSGLTKKLTSGLFVTVVLEHLISTTIPYKSTYESSAALVFGLFLGYGAALVAAFLPYPVFATRSIRTQLSVTIVALGSLTQLLLDDLRNAALQTPHFIEVVSQAFNELDASIASLKRLVGPAQAETLGIVSFEPVYEYQKLCLFVRSQLKGVYLGLRKRQQVPPEFSNYEALRAAVEQQELALGAAYTAFFDKLAMLDGDTAAERERIHETYKAIRDRIAVERATFINIELVRLQRGVHLWPEEMLLDLFSTYFTLSSLAEIRIKLDEFTEPKIWRWSLAPWKSAFVNLMTAWMFSSSRKKNIARLFNCLVITLSVLIASLFVAVPQIAATFPSGVSAAVTCVFIFDDASFGSTLVKSRERVVGIVMGGTFSYVAILSVGSLVPGVSTTVLMTFYVALVLLLIGFDTIGTAYASIFSVGLALYHTGSTLVVTDNFATISNYFVANSLGAMFVVCVGALMWLIIVLFTRPTIYGSIRTYVMSVSHTLGVIVDRCHVDGTDLHELPSLAPQLDEIRRLAAEIPFEPTFVGSAQPDMYALQHVINLLTSVGSLLEHLDAITRGLNSENGLTELKATSVMAPVVVNALSDLRASLTSTLEQDIVGMLSLRQDLALNWRGDEIRWRVGHFVDSASRSFPGAFRYTKSIVSNRPIVRWIATAFSLLKMGLLIEQLFHAIFVLSASARRIKVMTK